MFGRMGCEPLDAKLHHPWVKQLYKDLDRLAQAEEQEWTVTEKVRQEGIQFLWGPEWSDTFLRWDTQKIRSYANKPHTARPRAHHADDIQCGHQLEDGTACTYTGTQQQVNTHARQAHGWQHPLSKLIYTNQSAICMITLSSKQSAQHHLIRAGQLGHCPQHKQSDKWAFMREVEAMEVAGCVECGQSFEGWEHASIQQHMAGHVRRVLGLREGEEGEGEGGGGGG